MFKLSRAKRYLMNICFFLDSNGKIGGVYINCAIIHHKVAVYFI